MRKLAFAAALGLVLAASASADLIAYWPMDTDVVDSIPGYTPDVVEPLVGSLLISGNATLTADGGGRTGLAGDRAFSYDGDSWLAATEPAPWPNIQSAVTVSAWVYSTENDGHIVCQGGGWSDPGFSMFWCRNPNPDAIRVELQDSGQTMSDNPAPTQDAWHHVAFTWDQSDGTIRTYIDATDGQPEPNQPSYAGPIGTPTHALWIGHNEARYSENRGFDGRIDDVAIWNEALDGTQIQFLADGNSPLDALPPVLTWDHGTQFTGNWGDSNWVCSASSPPPFPTVNEAAAINDGHVTVADDRGALALEHNGGNLVIGAGKTLEVATTFETSGGAAVTVAGGSLKVGGTANLLSGAPVVLEDGSSLEVGQGLVTALVIAGDTEVKVNTGLLGAGAIVNAGAASLTKTGAGTLGCDNSAGLSNLALTDIVVEQGELYLRGANPLAGATDVTLRGGMLTLEPGVSAGGTADDLTESYYSGDSLALIDGLAGGGGYLAQSPTMGQLYSAADGGAPTVLDIDQTDSGASPTTWDTHTNGHLSGTPDNFGAVWSGTMLVGVGGSPLAPGPITLGTASDDASVWIVDGQVIVNNLGDPPDGYHGREEDTATVTLGAGAHQVVIGFMEGGGGANMEAKFGQGAGLSYGSLTFVDPTNPAQANLWTSEATTDMGDLSGVTITAEASGSTLNIATTETWALGTLDMTPGSDLTTIGGPVTFGSSTLGNGSTLMAQGTSTGLGAAKVAGSTTLNNTGPLTATTLTLDDGDAISFVGSGPTTIDTLVNAGGTSIVNVPVSAQVTVLDAQDTAAGTVTKQGDGQLTLDTLSAGGATNTTFQVDAGTLLAIGADPLGDSTKLTLAGGTAAFGDGSAPPAPGPTAGLISHWTFDETSGTTAADTQGANAGTISGGVTLGVPGPVGTAFDFDGSSGQVDVGSVGISGAAPRSIAGWFKSDSADPPSDWRGIFGFYDDSSTGDLFFGVDVINNNDAGIHVYNWERPLADLETSSWHHAAATYDGTNIAWYYDGALVGSEARSGLNTTDYFTMSWRRDNNNRFDGQIDDVHVYSSVLTADDVEAMYGARIAPDTSNINVLVTANSTLESRSTSPLAFADLTVNNDATLTTTGSAMTFASTAIGAASGTLDVQNTVDIGDYGDGGAPKTFIKRGSGELVVDSDAHTIVAADTTWRVEQGTLHAIGADPFDGPTHAELAGGTLTIEPPATPADATYQYFRFTPTKLRDDGAANSVQLSEMQVFYGTLQIPGATATNPGGSTPDAEGPEKAVDNNTGTKWLDFNKAPLVLDFGSAVTIDEYNWATANDATERDPVRWTFEGSNDNANWTLVDSIAGADYPTPTARYTFAGPFTTKIFAGDLDLTDLTVHGTANSTLNIVYPLEATVGQLTLDDGVVLSTMGAPTTFTETVLAGGSGTLDVQNTVDIGDYVGGSGKTLIKDGPGTMIVDNVAHTINGAGTTFEVRQGLLTADAPDPLGGSTDLHLAGGTASFGDTVAPPAPGPTTGLISHWTFDETSGTTAFDTQTANPGTISGGVTLGVPGAIGTAFDFDGNDGQVDVGSVGVSGAAPRSIAGWFKSDSADPPSDWKGIFGFYSASSGGDLFFGIDVINNNDAGIHVYNWERPLADLETSSWHHAAATYDGTNIAWYYDGMLVGSEARSGLNTTDYFTMAWRRDNDNRFDGQIDDVHVYSSVLTADDVETMYGARIAPDTSNINVLVSANSTLESRSASQLDFADLTLNDNTELTVAGGPMSFANAIVNGTAAINSDQHVTLRDYDDGAGANRTLIKRGSGPMDLPDGGPTSGASTTFQVEGGSLNAGGATDPLSGGDLVMAGGTVNLTAPKTAGVIPTGAVGAWTFDAGDADDSSGNGYHGTQNGGAFSSDVPEGLSGQSINLTGNGSINVDDGAGQTVFDLDTLTVAAWVKGWPDNGWDPYISKRGESNQGWQFRRIGWGDSDDKLTMTLRGTSGDDDVIGASNIIQQNPDEWFHIVATYDNATGIRRWYINGVLDGEVLESGDISNTGSQLVFGARDNSGDAGNPPSIGNHSNTWLDDIYIYDRALIEADIQAMLPQRGPLVMPDTNVRVAGGGTLNAVTDKTATFGDLTLQSGALTIAGAREGVFFAGGAVDSSADSIGLDAAVDVTVSGSYDGQNATASFTKSGGANLILTQGTTNHGGVAVDVQGGRLISNAAMQAAGLNIGGGANVDTGTNDVTISDGGAFRAGALKISGAGSTFKVGGDDMAAAPERLGLEGGTVTVRVGAMPGGLAVWLDASDVDGQGNGAIGDPTDGQTVATWADRSGNGNSATQGNANRQPVYIASAISGQPALRFNADNVEGDDEMKLGDLSAQFPDAATLFAVAYIDSDGRYNVFGNRNNDERWKADTWSEAVPGSFRGGRQGYNFDDLPSDGSHIFAIESNSSVWRMLVDSSNLGDRGADYHSGSGQDWAIADRSNGGQELKGDIAELLIFNRALSATEMGKIGGYLAAKYGIGAAGWTGNIDPMAINMPDTDIHVASSTELFSDTPSTATYGNLNLGGTPGVALTLTGAPGGTFFESIGFDIEGFTPGTEHDQMIFQGPGHPIATGSELDILTPLIFGQDDVCNWAVLMDIEDPLVFADGIFTDARTGLPLPEGASFIDGNGAYFWQISYQYEGNDVAIHLTGIPEPTTMALLGLGAVALLRRRRRQA